MFFAPQTQKQVKNKHTLNFPNCLEPFMHSRKKYYFFVFLSKQNTYIIIVHGYLIVFLAFSNWFVLSIWINYIVLIFCFQVFITAHILKSNWLKDFLTTWINLEVSSTTTSPLQQLDNKDQIHVVCGSIGYFL